MEYKTIVEFSKDIMQTNYLDSENKQNNFLFSKNHIKEFLEWESTLFSVHILKKL